MKKIKKKIEIIKEIYVAYDGRQFSGINAKKLCDLYEQGYTKNESYNIIENEIFEEFKKLNPQCYKPKSLMPFDILDINGMYPKYTIVTLNSKEDYYGPFKKYVEYIKDDIIHLKYYYEFEDEPESFPTKAMIVESIYFVDVVFGDNLMENFDDVVGLSDFLTKNLDKE